MFSHIVIGVQDFESAYAFYGLVLSRLGLEERFCDRSRPCRRSNLRPRQMRRSTA